MKNFTIKSAFLALFISVLVNSICNAQVGIGTVTPSGTLDITSTNDGLLIPRIALSATNVATVLTPTVSELVYNTFTSALGPNQVAPVIIIGTEPYGCLFLQETFLVGH